jgi:hypothetical protein
LFLDQASIGHQCISVHNPARLKTCCVLRHPFPRGEGAGG